MSKTIIFATGNEGKMREIKEVLSHDDFKVLSMKEAGVSAEPEETGETFEENAVIKAEAVAELCRASEEYKDAYVVADDSGLEIDYLNKEPGVHSARFMGHDTPYIKKNTAILEKLAGVPKEKRTARFVCAMALITPDGKSETVKNTLEGFIADKISGENGFGYDPIFFVEELGCTSAMISTEEKNRISHRGKSLRALRDVLLAKAGQ